MSEQQAKNPKPLTVGRPELLVKGSDAPFREVLHAFMIFARRLEAVRDVLASRLGVTAPQYEILSHLREADGALKVGAIAACLHCTGPFVTNEVRKLVELGLVTKRRDPADARGVYIVLTPRCEKRFRLLATAQRLLNDVLFASVSARDFDVLHSLLPSLVADGDRALAAADEIIPAARPASA